MAGRRPVEEAFVAHRPAIRLLIVPHRRGALEKLVLHATSLRIPIVEVEGGSLTALAGFDGHQGIALVVEPRRYADLDDMLARAAERGEPPFILVLDSLEDPHNVGSLLRSAEAAGVHGVVFPMHRQAPLSPSAIKASAGAIEHLLLHPAEDLPGLLSDMHARGIRIVGADGEAPLTARQTDLRGPLALIVGSEGQGLGPAVRRRSDAFVRIPMKGAVGSLNAAVAGSILLFEALGQRDGDPGPPAEADRAGAPERSDAVAVDHATTEAPPAEPDTAGMTIEPTDATSELRPAERDTNASTDPGKLPLPATKRRASRRTTGSDQLRSAAAPSPQAPVSKRGSSGKTESTDLSADIESDELLPDDATPKPARRRARKSATATTGPGDSTASG